MKKPAKKKTISRWAFSTDYYNRPGRYEMVSYRTRRVAQSDHNFMRSSNSVGPLTRISVPLPVEKKGRGK